MMRAKVRQAATQDRPTRWVTLVLCLLIGFWTSGPAAAQEEDAAPPSVAVEVAVEIARVVIDGETFFKVKRRTILTGTSASSFLKLESTV